MNSSEKKKKGNVIRDFIVRFDFICFKKLQGSSIETNFLNYDLTMT